MKKTNMGGIGPSKMGKVKTSPKPDGVAMKGKTRGKMVAMAGNKMAKGGTAKMAGGGRAKMMASGGRALPAGLDKLLQERGRTVTEGGAVRSPMPKVESTGTPFKDIVGSKGTPFPVPKGTIAPPPKSTSDRPRTSQLGSPGLRKAVSSIASKFRKMRSGGAC